MVSYYVAAVITDKTVNAFSHLLRLAHFSFINSEKTVSLLASEIRLQSCKFFINFAWICDKILNNWKHLQRFDPDILHIFQDLCLAHKHRLSINFSGAASAHTLSAIPPESNIWFVV